MRAREVRAWTKQSIADPVTYTVSEIAAAAGVSIATVRRWIKAGKLVPEQNNRRAYQCTEPAIRACMESLEGYSADAVLDALTNSDCDTAEWESAFIMGRVFALLDSIGAVPREHLPVAAAAPSRYLGTVLSFAMQRRPEAYSRIAPMVENLMARLDKDNMTRGTLKGDVSTRFWAGFFWQKTHIDDADGAQGDASGQSD